MINICIQYKSGSWSFKKLLFEIFLDPDTSLTVIQIDISPFVDGPSIWMMQSIKEIIY